LRYETFFKFTYLCSTISISELVAITFIELETAVTYHENIINIVVIPATRIISIIFSHNFNNIPFIKCFTQIFSTFNITRIRILCRITTGVLEYN